MGWSWLSHNEGLPWTDKLFKQYIVHWDWHELSSNPALPWSINLLDSHIEKWNWTHLSSNVGLQQIMFEDEAKMTNKMSPKLVDRYVNYWKWDDLMSNETFPWNVDIISKYETKWHWDTLFLYAYEDLADILTPDFMEDVLDSAIKNASTHNQMPVKF